MCVDECGVEVCMYCSVLLCVVGFVCMVDVVVVCVGDKCIDVVEVCGDVW